MTDEMNTPSWRDNPWGLTEGEVRALAAFVATGSVKGACNKLQRSVHTLNAQCDHARSKMAQVDSSVCRSRVRYLILFDRWARGPAAGPLELPRNG